ncbi:cupin domain-containing protein [Stenotrophomonas rhizophila]|uniref:cupin domain-containing protein n=1 Tax=Stenotrophomonas rhizophila TaxID=216778 RepID=UPI00045689BC|nr:cupin domain-containing protein [Stenotrophomonas rhizophila]AHY60944.1 cupin [Stenotrophomonas rhizophila]
MILTHRLALATLITLAVSACAANPPAPTTGTDPLVSLPSAQLHWQDVPGTQGAVSYANTQGNILSDGEGFYSAFVRFKAGTDNGLHTHSQTLPTVVLSGTFYARIDGKEVLYPAGSYYSLPANRVHESGCKAGTDCLLFQYQANNFDLVPASS